MLIRELPVPDAYECAPPTFPDARGLYYVPLHLPSLSAVLGYRPVFAQVNHALSRRGAVRGPHFADVPPGQAKFAYCSSGALLDLVVDLRVGSPTFGRHAALRLDATQCHGVYLAEGLAHAVVALEDDTVLTYLSSTPYDSEAEHGVNPLDPALGLPLPAELELIVSERDRTAPTIGQARAAGCLPRYEDCLRRYRELRRRPVAAFA
ncbi:dTDP-4-dehydrorhamnose 3,5-epimerase family protein [Dactylosporangium vinaceum]|uniref:dTDP-4-dehydrorhamnose 3,5-epimerase family protein n=1 Tax=Dactylosporangium vinaceum TaxID=53362 RepID=A0ABV5M3A0_9ACTN|nr:dTDP-4-dehydrorhamnose 3,5-epimerase family protein [Dactylosporangium vinaceum]UAB99739.1 dTDP-4-dehydrorhamnose 3,5-epimerase family protein [Dactylosporangium vinaceum]